MRIAVLTVSDSRTPGTDVSGDLLVQLVSETGHHVAERALLRDEVPPLVQQLQAWVRSGAVDVVLSTGGTGITGRDVTPEAFAQVLEKELPGFAEIFRAQSFAKIGPAAVLSRAIAGVSGSTFLFALPGSPGAVQDAWDSVLSGLLGNGAEGAHCTLSRLLPRLHER